jgi:hypothetical protein
MTEILTSLDLEGAEADLQALANEVTQQEGHLGGGNATDIGGEAVAALRQTRVWFGNPRSELVRLTPALFKKLGLELDPILKQQIGHTFDFYYLTLAVNMQPGDGVQFARLVCYLDLGPKGPDEPIVHTLWPTSEWKEVLNWGGAMKLGLSTGLDWRVEAGLPASMRGALPGDIQAKLANENQLQAFIAIPDYRFGLGRVELAATGKDSAEVFWDVQKPELKQAQSVKFGVVFKVPPGTERVTLEARAWVEPSFPWLVARLGNVFGQLGSAWQSLFDKSAAERRGREKLARGKREIWEQLPLPAA